MSAQANSIAPNVGELLGLALTALVNARGVFARLNERPAPGPGASLLVALAWGALFFALNLIHIAISIPDALQPYAPSQIGAVAFLGLGAWTALCLLGASFVYGLGRALGSEGDFDRALLVAAVALAAAPLQALCGWFPTAWFVPALVAAWILACGLIALFKAGDWPARGVCAVLASALLAVQYGAAMVVGKYTAASRLAAAAAQAASFPSQLAGSPEQMQQVRALAEEAQTAQTGPSSLELLRGPGTDEVPAAEPTRRQLAQMSDSSDAMNKSVVGMLDSIGPMLDNPAITQNMTPRQKSDYAELKKMIQELKTDIAANTSAPPREQQVKMMKIQRLLMSMMSAGMATTQASPPK